MDIASGYSDRNPGCTHRVYRLVGCALCQQAALELLLNFSWASPEYLAAPLGLGRREWDLHNLFDLCVA